MDGGHFLLLFQFSRDQDRNIIEHRRTGPIVKPGDVKGLASALGR
jgi:hypothetical protein